VGADGPAKSDAVATGKGCCLSRLGIVWILGCGACRCRGLELSLFFRERPPGQLLPELSLQRTGQAVEHPYAAFAALPSHSASYLQSVRAKTGKIGRSIEKAKENQLLYCFFIQNLNFK
jgi:hypothetical protein